MWLKLFARFFWLILLTGLVALYSPLFNKEFHFDSHLVIEENYALRSVLPVNDFFLDRTTYSSSFNLVNYRPLLLVNYALNYKIDKLNMPSWHLVQLLMHFMVCILVFYLSKELIARFYINVSPTIAQISTYFIVIIFAFHPLQVGVINYLHARSEIQMVMFLLMAQLSFIYSKDRHLKSLLVALCYGAAIFTKLNAISLFAMLLLYITAESLHANKFWPAFKGRVGKERPTFILLFLVTSIYFLLRVDFFTGYDYLGINGRHDLSSWSYFFNQCNQVFRYAQRLFIPLGLSTDYHGTVVYQSFFAPIVIAFATLWIMIFILACKQFFKRPQIFLCIASFLVVLAPTSSFFVLNDVWNEHRSYLANVYILILFVPSLLSWCRKKYSLRKGVLALSLYLVFVVSLSIQRMPDFKTEISYWNKAVEMYPSVRSYQNLAVSLMEDGRESEAIKYFAKAKFWRDRGMPT